MVLLQRLWPIVLMVFKKIAQWDNVVSIKFVKNVTAMAKKTQIAPGLRPIHDTVPQVFVEAEYQMAVVTLAESTLILACLWRSVGIFAIGCWVCLEWSFRSGHD